MLHRIEDSFQTFIQYTIFKTLLNLTLPDLTRCVYRQMRRVSRLKDTRWINACGVCSPIDWFKVNSRVRSIKNEQFSFDKWHGCA